MDKSLIFDYIRECVITQGLTRVEEDLPLYATPSYKVVLIGKSVRVSN